jgi:hypothetical protein
MFAVRDSIAVNSPSRHALRAGVSLAFLIALAVITSHRRPFARAREIPQLYAEFVRSVGNGESRAMRLGAYPTSAGFQDHIRTMVAGETVDVFGYHQGLAMISGMNFTPRPVFQSYFAYTPALQKTNLDFYLGRSRPNFVLFRLETINNRFPTLDDAPLLLHLLGAYEPVASSDTTLLLRARTKSLTPRMTPLGGVKLRLGQPLLLANYANRLIVARINLDLNAAGELVKLLWRAPGVSIHVRTADGRDGSYTFIPSMARSGFLLTPLVLSNTDLYGGGSNRRGLPLHDIRFVGSSGQRLYDDTIKVELFELTF